MSPLTEQNATSCCDVGAFFHSPELAFLNVAFSARGNLDTAAFIPGHRYDAETLERKLFAVHATNIFPEDGIMRVGMVRRSDVQPSADYDPPSFRPTSHWSLGELVRMHGPNSWEDNRFAIIVPLGQLGDQLVNVNAYDTFTIGDFKIPEGGIVVVPQSDSKKIPDHLTVIRYSEDLKLRDAVAQAIEKYGGWPVRMRGRSSADSVACIDGHNINTVQFFSSFLAKYPQVAFGDHILSLVGEACSIGNIEGGIRYIAEQYDPYARQLDTAEMVFAREFIRLNLHKFQALLEAKQFPENVQASVQAKLDKVHAWLTIVDADLELRVKQRQTLAVAEETVYERLTSLVTQPEAFRAYVADLCDKGQLNFCLPEASLYVADVAEMLKTQPHLDAEYLLAFAESHELFTPGERRSVMLLYTLKRTLCLGMSGAEREGLVQKLDEAICLIQDTQDRRIIADKVMRSLVEYLDMDSGNLSVALHLLQKPPMRMLMQERYQISLPQDGLTLETFIRIHPETRALFDTPEVLVDSVSHRILCTLESPPTFIEVPQISSYIEARYLAMNLCYAKKMYHENLNCLTKPMFETAELEDLRVGCMLTLCERIKRKDFGTLQELWTKLGLANEFRKTFKSDNDFWSSRSSFLEIYEELMQLSRQEEKPSRAIGVKNE